MFWKHSPKLPSIGHEEKIHLSYAVYNGSMAFWNMLGNRVYPKQVAFVGHLFPRFSVTQHALLPRQLLQTCLMLSVWLLNSGTGCNFSRPINVLREFWGFLVYKLMVFTPTVLIHLTLWVACWALGREPSIEKFILTVISKFWLFISILTLLHKPVFKGRKQNCFGSTGASLQVFCLLS